MYTFCSNMWTASICVMSDDVLCPVFEHVWSVRGLNNGLPYKIKEDESYMLGKVHILQAQVVF